ncbi:MAG: hypothetical protein WC435_02090 [Candidatus Paceibacterota bacterium]
MFFWLKNNWKKTALLSFFFVIFSFSFNFVLAQETATPTNGQTCSSFPSCPSGVPKDATFNKEKNAWDYSYSTGVGEAISTGHDYYSYPEGKKISTDDDLLGSGVSRKDTISESGDLKTEYTGEGFISGFASFAMEGVFGFFLNVLSYITNVVFIFGSWLIDFAFSLNSRLMKMPIIKNGWSFARDFANLGFVLGILVISFATIIRQKQYGMQSLLFKFIQTAILINFSLVICGVLIDFAGIVTAYFLNNALISQPDISSAFSKLLDINKLYEVDFSSLSAGQKASALSASFMVGISTLLFSVLFTAFSAIFLIGLSIMLIYRFIFLSFLLILAPLAWFTGIFPKINYSGAWWNSFLRWTFFAPVSSFFIFLSIQSLTGGSVSSGASSSGAEAALSGKIMIVNGLGQIGNMIVVLGFLFGSMMVADRFGINGAKGTMSWANWVKDGTTNWLRRTRSKAVLGTGRFAYGQTIGRSGVGKRMEDWAKGEIKSEKASRLGLLTAKTVLGFKKRTSDTIFENYKKEAKNLSPEQISASARMARDPVKKAALQELLAEKGKLDKYPEYIDPLLFQKYGGDVDKITSSNILLSLAKDKKDETAKSVSESIKNLVNVDEKKNDELNDVITDFEESLVKALSTMKTADIQKGSWFDILEKGLQSGMTEDMWNKRGKQAAYRAISKLKPKEYSNIVKKASAENRSVMANRTLLAISGLAPKDFEDSIKTSDFSKNRVVLNAINKKREEGGDVNSELRKYILKSLNSAGSDDFGEEKKGGEEKGEEKKEEKK